MPYEFRMPDGTWKAGQGDTPMQAWRSLANRPDSAVTAPATPATPDKAAAQDDPASLERNIGRSMLNILPGGPLIGMSDTASEFVGGTPQAALDPLEGIGQLIEHVTGLRLAPQAIRDKLKSYRSSVEASNAGSAGRTAATVGSLFIPVGGEVTAITKAADAARASKAGLEAVSSALGPERAGPQAYAAVRDALFPGEKARRAMSRTLREPDVGRPIGGAVQDWRTGGAMDRLGAAPEAGGPRAPNVTPLRPSRAAGATRNVVPPDLPVGPPTAWQRARLGASDLWELAKRAAWEHPVAAGALRGAAGGAAEPVEGGGDYWTTKGLQTGLGALAAGGEPPKLPACLARWNARWAPLGVPLSAASVGLHHLFGPWAATLASLAPHYFALHHAHNAMRHAARAPPGRVAKALRHPRSQLATGAVTGEAVGGRPPERLYVSPNRDGDDDDEE